MSTGHIIELVFAIVCGIVMLFSLWGLVGTIVSTYSSIKKKIKGLDKIYYLLFVPLFLVFLAGTILLSLAAGGIL